MTQDKKEENNIFFECARSVHLDARGLGWAGFFSDSNAFDFSVVTMQNNLIADTALCRRQQKDQTAWDAYHLDIDTKDGYVLLTSTDEAIKREFNGNTFLSTDPGFVNLKDLDFRLNDASPAMALGFKPIPFDKIGLQVVRHRQTLPTRTQ